MKTLNTAMWHEQEMKLCLEFNYHYSQKKPPKSHMFIFQYRLIYILLMLRSSYNRALLGIDVKSINEVAIQIKRKTQYYGSNWHINLKTNENPASHPTVKTFMYVISPLHI